MLNDRAIWEGALWHARCRRDWLEYIGMMDSPYSRRQCLARARRHEDKIVDLAIRVETALRRGGGGSPETPLVPKNSGDHHGRT